MNNNKKILLIGKIIGSYRSQLLINYLSQRNDQFDYIYIDKNYYKISTGNKYIQILSKIYCEIVACTIYLLSVLHADYVYFLPMNHRYFWVLKIASILNKKIIYDFYISNYIRAAQNKKMGVPSSANLKSEKRKDIIALENSTDILFLNNSEEIFYKSLYERDSHARVHYLSLRSERKGRALLSAFKGSKEKFNICWWGKASKVHGIDVIVNTIVELSKKRSDFEVNLFETEKKRADILTNKFGNVENVRIKVHHDLNFKNGLVEYLIQNCDIAIGGFGSTKMAETVLLNKLVDAINFGIPTVTQHTAAINEFGLDKIFFLESPQNPKEIAQKIEELINSSLDVNEFQEQCDKFFENYFSLEGIDHFFDGLFDS